MFDLILDDSEMAIRAEARAFARSVPADLLRRMDRDEVEYPREFVQSAAKERLLGVHFNEEWGGRGLTWVHEALAVAEAGVLGSALGCAFSMPTIVGEAIHTFGTPDQKERYLGRNLRGELISAEALTEPRGGSDFFGTTTMAVKKGDRYVLNGQKRFIVGGLGADFFLVYARTNPDVDPKMGISAFLVDRSDRVKLEHRFELLGLRGGGTARVVFDDAEVPEENVLGGPRGLHKGALVFSRMMVPERLTSAAGVLGFSEAAIRIAAIYSDRRKAFGQKIRRFQGVSFKIADSIIKLDASRALVVAAARAAEADPDSARTRRIISEAKCFATDRAWEIVNDCLQVLGGIGYTNVYPMERLLRDARLSTIWTGSNEVMRAVISHEYYQEILGAEHDGRDVEKDTCGHEYDVEKVFE
ncbi:MAG: acyl-CoA dehydrogenase family protein [Polyangia bacterium]|jgi:alkylation response protein AidB-like acyl-CoA dehydrogenase|nr:acyl-CoA dehydrogenase family protein [Polyangia bacterium]